jgi:hypothetical protein
MLYILVKQALNHIALLPIGGKYHQTKNELCSITAISLRYDAIAIGRSRQQK